MISRKCALAAAVLFNASAPLFGQVINVGANVNINRQTGYQAEQAVAINPANPNNLFAWSNDLNARNSAAFSTNGGASWTSRFTGTDGWPALGGDPTCSFDAFGNLYGASFNSAFTSILVRNSTDSGQTFGGAPLTISTASLDQPTIKAGPSPTVGQQSAWITYFSSTGLFARGTTSTTGLGAIGAFGAALAIPGSSSGNFGDVAIGPNGQVVVGFQTPTAGGGPSTIRTALNLTGSSAGAFSLAAATVPTNVGGFRSIPAQPSRTVDAELGLAYDNSTGPRRGRLYMVYTDAPTSTSNDLNIFTRFSTDNGLSWSAPVRVNDDLAGVNSQFFSKISCDPTTGNIAVSWYDCRNSPGNNTVQLWSAISIDGGATFLPNVKVSAGSTNGVGAGGGNELGDYIGLDFYGNVAYPAWADNSNSTGDNPNGTANLDYYGARVVLSGSRWAINGSGNWSPLADWIGAGVPSVANDVGTFGSVITAPVTVTLDGNRTVGTLNFDNANAYTITGASTLTLQSASGAGINVFNGNHKISSFVVLNSPTTFNTSPGTSLNLTGLQDTTQSITKVGAGQLILNRVRTSSSLTINSGTVSIAGDGVTANKVNTLSIAGGATPTATLDLLNNDLIIASSTYGTISGQIAFARHGGLWDRNGITSSTAATANPKNTTLGTLTGAQFLAANGAGATFDGVTVVNSDILVKYTYYGDTDFNGVIDFDDYSRTDNGFNSSATDWAHGDFDYNNVVDFDDYSLIDMAFNTQTGTLRRAMTYLEGGDRSENGMDSPALQLVERHFAQFGTGYAVSFLNAVPEPGCMALIGLAAGMLSRRSRARA